MLKGGVLKRKQSGSNKPHTAAAVVIAAIIWIGGLYAYHLSQQAEKGQFIFPLHRSLP
jgi:hypothetical protein